VYLLQRNKLRPQQLIDADIDDDDTAHIPDEEYTGLKCSHCLTRQTSVWRRSKTGQQVCNACGVYARLRGKERPLSLRRNKIKPRTKHSKDVGVGPQQNGAAGMQHVRGVLCASAQQGVAVTEQQVQAPDEALLDSK
jgi:hypothetical protein